MYACMQAHIHECTWMDGCRQMCMNLYVYIYVSVCMHMHTVSCISPIINTYVTGWQRYTRWTGRLSHQTSDLSHPHNLLPKGCDPCFT